MPYRFFVTARNVYGEGEESDELKYETGTKPGRPDAISGYNEEGEMDIHINWLKPSTNGSPILEYEIQIWNKDQREFVDAKEECDGSNQKVMEEMYCEISSTDAQDKYGY